MRADELKQQLKELKSSDLKSFRRLLSELHAEDYDPKTMLMYGIQTRAAAAVKNSNSSAGANLLVQAVSCIVRVSLGITHMKRSIGHDNFRDAQCVVDEIFKIIESRQAGNGLLSEPEGAEEKE